MVSSLDKTRLETLVLGRLLVRPAAGFGLSDLRRQLFPYVSHTLSDSDWRAQLDEVVATVRKAEWVEMKALRLTDEGQRIALKRLNLQTVPENQGWPNFVAEILIPATMDLPPERAALRSADDLVALLLAREFELKASAPLSLPRVLNAMVWRALGVDSDERLTAGALQRVVLRQHLSGTRVAEPERLARMLAAKVSGSRSVGPQPTRQAILREWLTPAASRTSSVDGESMPLETFAQAARVAARDPETIRFGDHKAFINSVFDRFLSEEGGPRMPMSAFKKKLVAAHRKGLLTLARADLVEAMDRERVAASETHYLNTTFHFVEAD